MQKISLRCDVCGGLLTMQSGGQMAVCGRCDMQYSLDRLREKLREQRGGAGSAKEETANLPSADFEIHAGILAKYHGEGTEVVIPQNVQEIASDCFSNGGKYITSVTLPQGLTKINPNTFAGFSSLKQIILPDSVTQIGFNAFNGCTSLEKINIPSAITEIGCGAFWQCTNLKNVIFSGATYSRLCPRIEETHYFEGIYYTWKWIAFSSNAGGYYHHDGSYPCIVVGSSGLVISYSEYNTQRISFTSDEFKNNTAPWFRQIAMQTYELIKAKTEEQQKYERWKRENRCQHCGGAFEGFFTKTCKQCGKVKDY